MSRTADILPRGPFSGDAGFSGQRHVPILPSGSSAPYQSSDAMDITPPGSAAIQPATSSPDMEHEISKSSVNGTSKARARENGSVTNQQNTMTPPTSGNTLSPAMAGQASQPKVVQTAFIHKLYNMLEDQSIRSLISWSSSNDSFVMSPSADFSKVLAQYFKHTNISSFVRQLNMYGFHKVSDVFHNGAPDSALWEFKHGNGNFKRGDVAGLREIKRRASRHALIQRDSFSTGPHKPSISQPCTPAESIPETPTGDHRLAHFEHNLYEMHARLMRTEESNTALSSRCAVLSEGLARAYQYNNDLAQIILKLIPDRDSQIYRDGESVRSTNTVQSTDLVVSTLQRDVAHQTELAANFVDPHEALMSGARPHFSSMNLDPMSPRLAAADERRASMLSTQTTPHRPSLFRPPMPPHLALSPRRYGSIGTSPPKYTGSANNPQRPSIPVVQYAQPGMPSSNPPHPLSAVSDVSESGMATNLARRHTSADIRDNAGWPPNPRSPYDTPSSSTPTQPTPPPPTMWASSFSPAPNQDQHVRESLATYTFGAPRRAPQSRTASPPDPAASASSAPSGSTISTGLDGSWSQRIGSRLLDIQSAESAPVTRRSSMAHILNPTEERDREGEDGEGEIEERKRKRIN